MSARYRLLANEGESIYGHFAAIPKAITERILQAFVSGPLIHVVLFGVKHDSN